METHQASTNFLLVGCNVLSFLYYHQIYLSLIPCIMQSFDLNPLQFQFELSLQHRVTTLRTLPVFGPLSLPSPLLNGRILSRLSSFLSNGARVGYIISGVECMIAKSSSRHAMAISHSSMNSATLHFHLYDYFLRVFFTIYCIYPLHQDD